MRSAKWLVTARNRGRIQDSLRTGVSTTTGGSAIRSSGPGRATLLHFLGEYRGGRCTGSGPVQIRRWYGGSSRRPSLHEPSALGEPLCSHRLKHGFHHDASRATASGYSVKERITG